MNQTIARFAAERLPVEFVHHYLSHTHMNMHQFHPRVRSKAERALRSTVTYDRFLTWEDELFPSALLHIPNPPYCLFYRGDLEVLHQQTTALVGSRELNRISRRLVEHFRPLIEETVSVSGGALGIDGLVTSCRSIMTGRPSPSSERAFRTCIHRSTPPCSSGFRDTGYSSRNTHRKHLSKNFNF